MTQLEATVEVKKDQIIAKDLSLQDMVLDPVNKGHALTIAFVHKQSEYSHIVESPVEVLESHNNEGQATVLEITDRNFDSTGLIYISLY